MPYLFQYLIKFSISLAALYTFYYIVLRPLTFYQWNRFYLVCYSLLSFIIPFINVTEWLAIKNINNSYFINSIPAVDKLTSTSFNGGADTKILAIVLSWEFAGVLFLTGATVMLSRIIYQYLSLRTMKRKAVLLKTGDFEFYDVNGPIAPFSFANAVFINSRLHSEEEFHKILEHEFVHIKQKHTIDIVVAELVCVFNWFNPFAWLIRKSIRENLEFIADNNVLDGGIDPRQYQYLLLKVMGLPQYSITNNFSFSSLKKRIVMMNKMKSAKVHLVKFLFVLPLLAVMLLAFRGRSSIHQASSPGNEQAKQQHDKAKKQLFKIIANTGEVNDTVPHPAVAPVPSTGAVVETLTATPFPAETSAPSRNAQAARVVTPATSTTPAAAGVRSAVGVEVVRVVPKEDDNVKVVIGKKLPGNAGRITTVRSLGAEDTVVPKVVVRSLAQPGSGEPLYIVDGKELAKGEGLNALPAESISSINVLKGADAVAMFGSRAENGVLIITTKNGAAIKSLLKVRPLEDFSGILIVDGTETPINKMSTIDPDAVESVEVLKGGASLAKYGEKGKEGVIIVTTKNKHK